MKKALFILFFFSFLFSISYSQEKAKAEIRKVKLSDLEKHNGSLIEVLSFLDSTRDYSGYDILTYQMPLHANSKEEAATHEASHCCPILKKLKPGAYVHFEKIKYVPKGQTKPVKVFPDVHFKIVE